MAIKHGLGRRPSVPVTAQATGLSTILRRLSGWTYFDQQGCLFVPRLGCREDGAAFARSQATCQGAQLRL
jgi:hypothetical protein